MTIKQLRKELVEVRERIIATEDKLSGSKNPQVVAAWNAAYVRREILGDVIARIDGNRMAFVSHR